MSLKLLLSVTALISLVGCASITGSSSQNISITSKDKDRQVSGVACELSNSKGKWFISTPGSLQIGRSNDELMVICKKEGLDTGMASVESDTKAGMIGNIIFGGGIGAIIDHNTGAAYEYPNTVEVLMGMQTKITIPKVNNQSASPNDVGNATQLQQNQAANTQINSAPIIVSTSLASPSPEPATQYIGKERLSSPGGKLEELNGMLKKGLITQQDYDTKKAQILKSM